MYQQILRTLLWREMKDSEGELKVVKIWSLWTQVYMYSFTRLTEIQACFWDNVLSNFAFPGQVLVYLFSIPN